MTVKTVQAVNLARSAIAPETRATAMIAKTTWKATKAAPGMPPAAAVPVAASAGRSRRSASSTPFSPKCVEGVADEAAADVGAERLAVAPEDPHRADRAHGDEATSSSC